MKLIVDCGDKCRPFIFFSINGTHKQTISISNNNPHITRDIESNMPKEIFDKMMKQTYGYENLEYYHLSNGNVLIYTNNWDSNCRELSNRAKELGYVINPIRNMVDVGLLKECTEINTLYYTKFIVNINVI